jgi:WD40 repeat protein
VCWHPDCRSVAIVSGSYVRVYDVSEFETKVQLVIKAGPFTGVNAVAFNPDGTRLATGGSDNRARIWHTVTGHKLLEIRQASFTAVESVAFSPDGTRLAAGSSDNSAPVWDAVSGQQLLVMRHDGGVTSVAFSPDGTRLATGRSEGALNYGTVRIWDAAMP